MLFRSVCGTRGSLRTLHGGGSVPSCCAFTHRVAFEEAPARVSGQFLARPRHLCLQQLFSRDSRAFTEPRLLHSREGRPGRPCTLRELSEVLSSGLWAGSGCGQALRGQEQVENVEEEIQKWESGTNNQSLGFQICKLGE